MRSVIHRKFPHPYGKTELPDPVALNGFLLPAPQSMLPVTPSLSGDVSNNFYNSGHAIMKISNANGDYLEVMFVKTGIGYAFSGKILKTTYSDTAKPSNVYGVLVHKDIVLLKEAFSNGAGQPQENIYNMDEDNYVELPNVKNGGLALNVFITWPGTPPTGYWNVEVEFTDLYGSSEASI